MYILIGLLMVSIFYNIVLWYKQNHYTQKYVRKYRVNENEVKDTFMITKKGKKTHVKATRNGIITIEFIDNGNNKDKTNRVSM
ncbi:hypothetical protein COO16_04135 [Bacillus pseudomycoides]|uniref:hypothetical protein n=1 Tax=Bacillus pseudomycoides TaxID=64104 RepID=UPI000BEB46F2|nr:hypothetical protein [Bacillus pseudomycoides]PDY14157.1 hypothetical protein COO16_04135 [Bacillus pseudomycoides]